MIRGNWQINGISVAGPDRVEYTPSSPAAIRLDRIPVHFGSGSLAWIYSVLPMEELAHILQILDSSPRSVEIRYYTEAGTWTTRRVSWELPVIGGRSQMIATNVSILFRSYAGFGGHAQLSTGKNPDTGRFSGVPNPPPTARIKHTVSLWGDPEVVVTLDGTRSSDSDSGIVASYLWQDNSSDFSGLPGFPFDPPHTSTEPTTTFIYEYSSSMPNPIITLTVTDNAGQSDTATLDVSIQALVGSSAIFGKSFIVAARSKVHLSQDGGLNFITHTGFSGEATAAAGGAGFAVFGTSEGRIYRIDANRPLEYSSVFQFSGSWPKALRSLSIIADNPMHVLAVCSNGDVAFSLDGGRYFSLLDSFPEELLCGALFYHDSRLLLVGAERGTGPKVLTYFGRNYGVLWENQSNGLPDETSMGVGAVAGSSRMQYAGLIGYSGSGGEFPIYGRTGTHWLPLEMFPDGQVYPIDIVGMDMPDDGGVYAISGQGWVYKLRELIVEKSLLLDEGSVTGRCVVIDPVQFGVLLFGTSNGLYKSLDDLTTHGMLALPGEDIWDVDFFKDPKPPIGEILAPTWGGPTGHDGVWWYRADNGAGVPGWTLRKGVEKPLPDGIYWERITTSPVDPYTWVVIGNTVEDVYVYDIGVLNGSPVVIMTLTQSAPISPVWVTTDAGLSWEPFWVRLPAEVSEVYRYTTWETLEEPRDVVTYYDSVAFAHADYSLDLAEFVFFGTLRRHGISTFTDSCVWRGGILPNGTSDPGVPIGRAVGSVDNGGGWHNPVAVVLGADGDVVFKNAYRIRGAGGHTSAQGFWGYASTAPTAMMTQLSGTGNDTDNNVRMFRHSTDVHTFFAVRPSDSYILLGSTSYRQHGPVNRIIFPDTGPAINHVVSLAHGVFLFMSDSTVLYCLDPFTTPETELVYDVGHFYTDSGGTVRFSGMTQVQSDNQSRLTCVFLIQHGIDGAQFVNHFHRYDVEGWTLIPPPDDVSRFRFCTTVVT